MSNKLNPPCIFARSPLGPIEIRADESGITMVSFVSRVQVGGAIPRGLLNDAAKQLDEYFRGRRRGFDLPLAATGTAFQQRVWRALATIPYGETVSYAELASRIGNPQAARAVGQANNGNPIAVIVPCHRVVFADGSLGGYAGGQARKRRLIALEGGAIPA